MKNNKMRIMSLLIVIVMVFGFIPASTFALDSAVAGEEQVQSDQQVDQSQEQLTSDENVLETDADNTDNNDGSETVIDSDAEETNADENDSEASDSQEMQKVSEAEEPDSEKNIPEKKTSKKSASSIKALTLDAGKSAKTASNKTIYIGGTGDDANDGLTPEKPVMTFAKAKALLDENGADKLAVVSTVKVTSSQKWDLDGKTIVRDQSFTSGTLISVSAKLEIENTIIDGGYNADSNSSVSGSAIYIKNADMRLGSGTVIQNGHSLDGGGIYGYGTGMIYFDGGIVKDCSATRYGGAVYATDKVVMNKGSIEDCKANTGGGVFVNGNILQVGAATIDNCSAEVNGGGIYANKSKVYMADKEAKVSGCSAKANGGGIFLAGIVGQSNLYFSNGSVTGNYSGVVGGGIASSKSVIYMSNGTISNNTTAKVGGGIYLTDGSIGTIRSSVGGTNTDGGKVYITGNTANATNENDGPMVLSGGGIYVDGRTVAGKDLYYPVSKLYMDNVLISDNHAGVDGGGLASCPTGSIDMHVADGSAIYDNSIDSESGSDDIIVIRDGTTTADGTLWKLNEHESTAYIPASMLGGGAYHWKGADGEEIPLNKLYNVREFRSHTDVSDGSDESAAAKNLATVFIQNNNAAGIGGGVATNGLLKMGEPSEAVIDFAVTKSWVDKGSENLRPESIQVVVKQNGSDYGFVNVEPGDDGMWKTAFTGLPKYDTDGKQYEYTVEENAVSVEGGVYKTTYDTNSEADAEFTITNTFVADKPVVISKTDITGTEEIADAKLIIRDSEGNTVASWTSEAGKSHTVYLQEGTYTLIETQAPDNYVKAESIDFTVDSDGIIRVGNDIVDKVLMKDDYAEHAFRILKTDMDGKALSDAEFVLSQDEDGTDIVSEWKSTENVHKLSLKPGTYYLIEKSAPSDYKKLTGSVKIEVAVDGTITAAGNTADTDKIVYDGDELQLIVKNELIDREESPDDQHYKDEDSDDEESNDSSENVEKDKHEKQKPEKQKPEKQTSEKADNGPKTGDSADITPWLVVLLVAGASLTSVLIYRKKRV